ncbi:MAG TPA: transcriptional regulator [Vicinamibacterales bacterium]|nr:transcriptional regulator [Vicinamibacterales bacterium]HOQ60189.1 transcriptional regulator [Vicinamibacterales bacterium]HPK71120.1 transcriptional regulator [Vicinamibacterales bacterium]HPW21139.1 transcriptional regulator [Vicinamibacterales bacterium]
MPRNAEVIRQWKILRSIEAARCGLTVAELAASARVVTRTIWRDLAALQEAGFPLVDESRDNRTYWKINQSPFKHLTQLGLSLSELCALYLSRRLVESLVGVPFQTALGDAFAKFERDLPERMKQYLDRLPALMTARPATGRLSLPKGHDRMIEQLVDASVALRHVRMRYYSLSHDREADYLVYPLRFVCTAGAMYLRAWVPERSQVLTFAAHRVRRVSVLEERFVPDPEWAERALSQSLGPTSGPPVHIVLRFDRALAPMVAERQYHPSQVVTRHPDGSLTLELDVCDDVWLRSFVLQFGHRVRVIGPPTLAEQIRDELDAARRHYAPADRVEALATSQALIDLGDQWRLPF